MLQAEKQIDPARVVVYAQEGEVRAGAGQGGLGPLPGPLAWTTRAGTLGLLDGGVRPLPALQRLPRGLPALLLHALRRRQDAAALDRLLAAPGRELGLERDAGLPSGGALRRVRGCTAACPVGIPLGALTHHLNRAAVRHFGRPGGRGRPSLAPGRLPARGRGLVHSVARRWRCRNTGRWTI